MKYKEKILQLTANIFNKAQDQALSEACFFPQKKPKNSVLNDLLQKRDFLTSSIRGLPEVMVYPIPQCPLQTMTQ